MLTRSNEMAPQSEYYSDSLLKVPTAKQSVYDNLAIGVATPIVAMNMLDSDFSKKPEGRAILDSFNSVEMQNSTPGMSWSQWLAAQGSNMLGQALNPVSWGLGELGGLATKGIVSGAEKIAPDAASVFMRKPVTEMLAKPLADYVPATIGKEGSEKALSFGLMTEESLKHFGIGVGVGLPQSIVDNYQQDTGHINWGGTAREMGEMGAFGIAIGSIPFGIGVIGGKINRALGRDFSDSIDYRSLDSALEKGHITPDEHQWYKDYLDHQKNPSDTEMTESLKSRATDIINKNGHTANTVSNEAMFEMLTPQDVGNLQGIVGDQLAGNVPEPYKKSLSDFIVHNRMDYIRQNPAWLDGVRGYVDFVNKKLDMRAPKTEEANKILDDHMLTSVKDNMPFSQKELFRMMKKSGFEASHVQHLPVTIPENMAQHLKMMEKVDKLKDKLRKAKRRGEPENKQTLRRIGEIESKMPKILTPKEELVGLRKSLLSDKGLPKNWERSNAYHRLVDLAHVWKNARTLLDRVHEEYEYNRQEAFKDLASQVLKISDSDLPQISKPENVMDYLKHRIESNLEKSESIFEVNTKVAEFEKVPSDSETILDEQSQQIKNSQAETARDEYQQSADKFKEFKSSENIFKNLISCVLGGLGG